MSLNRQKGNMYEFITHTWNPIRGHCEYECSYCYMRKWGTAEPVRLHEKDLADQLGTDRFIFVGSSTDMWAEGVATSDIARVLAVCDDHPCNRYLFQSKNPQRFIDFIPRFPQHTVLGTTIESNINWAISKAPPQQHRADAMALVAGRGMRTMVTIEPILAFDLADLVALVELCRPSWVNIGADSQGNDLLEPDKGKVRMLATVLREHGLEVIEKRNLARLDRKG